jgi:hypothetical protein
VRNTLRLWAIGSGVLIVALLAGGWFLGAQPFLAAASAASDSAAQTAQANQLSRVKLAGYEKQAREIDQLKAQETAVASAVPASLDSNAFVARINAIAARVNVVVQSVSPGEAQAYAPPPSVALAAAATTAAAAPAASPAPTTATTSTAPVLPVLAASDPSITGTDLTVIPVTVSVKGTTEGTLQFTHALQHDQRLYLVTGYALASAQSGGKVLATLNGYIYSLKH